MESALGILLELLRERMWCHTGAAEGYFATGEWGGGGAPENEVDAEGGRGRKWRRAES